MTDFKGLLSTLAGHDVEFVLAGGLAGIAHGAARATYDLDVVYRRAPENARCLVTALSAHSPYLRGAPPGLPFVWDERTILRGLNFTLRARQGITAAFGQRCIPPGLRPSSSQTRRGVGSSSLLAGSGASPPSMQLSR